MDSSAFGRPSAYVPLIMSLIAFAIMLAHVVLVGTAREADEGAAAHLFQILIVSQAPIIAFFAITGLQRAPREALLVLAAQVAAIGAALAPLWYFNL